MKKLLLFFILTIGQSFGQNYDYDVDLAEYVEIKFRVDVPVLRPSRNIDLGDGCYLYYIVPNEGFPFIIPAGYTLKGIPRINAHSSPLESIEGISGGDSVDTEYSLNIDFRGGDVSRIVCEVDPSFWSFLREKSSITAQELQTRLDDYLEISVPEVKRLPIRN